MISTKKPMDSLEVFFGVVDPGFAFHPIFFWILKNDAIGTKDLNTFHGRKTFTDLKAKPGGHESELRFSI